MSSFPSVALDTKNNGCVYIYYYIYIYISLSFSFPPGRLLLSFFIFLSHDACTTDYCSSLFPFPFGGDCHVPGILRAFNLCRLVVTCFFHVAFNNSAVPTVVSLSCISLLLVILYNPYGLLVILLVIYIFLLDTFVRLVVLPCYFSCIL